MENEFTTLLTATDSKWSVDDVVNLSNSDRDVIYDGVIDYLTEEEFTFEFLVKVRDSYLEYETLTVGQVKGVINCIKATWKEVYHINFFSKPMFCTFIIIRAQIA